MFFIEWALGKLADESFNRLRRNDSLNSDIEIVVKNWAQSIKDEKYVNPAVFFGAVYKTEDSDGEHRQEQGPFPLYPMPTLLQDSCAFYVVDV